MSRRRQARPRWEDERFAFYLGTHKIDAPPSRADSRPEAAHHHHADALELQWFHFGNGYYFIGDRLYPIRPRSLFLIAPGVSHAYVSSAQPTLVQKTSLMLAPDLVREDLDRIGLAALVRRRGESVRRCVLFEEEAYARVEQLLALLRAEWSKRPHQYRDAIRLYLQQLFLEIERALAGASEGDDAASGGALTRRMLKFVDEHYRDSLSLTRVARHLDRTACHVSHLFPKATGLTFGAYLAARRVVEARRLLEQEEERKLYAIALAAGFGSISAFTRTFRRIAGMSPGRYRALHRPRSDRE